VSNKTELYRQNADECQTSARQSRNPADKVRWLSLAEQWLHMAQAAEAPTSERTG
jgi:hypothetical protein